MVKKSNKRLSHAVADLFGVVLGLVCRGFLIGIGFAYAVKCILD